MKRIEYHIENINASLHPVPGETNSAAVSLQLEMGEADLSENNTILQSELSIDMRLFRQDQDFDEEDPGFGEITIDMITYLDIENTMFPTYLDIEEEVETWNENGYQNVSPELIQEIEGDIMPRVLSPLYQLFQDSFRNIVPRLRFTHNPDEFDDSDE